MGASTARRPRRVRGPIPDWRPRRETRALIADVLAILDRERAYWPLSCRQVYYRLLGLGYPKSRQLAGRVSEHVSNARRAGVIPWAAIYDSGETWARPQVWAGAEEFADSARAQAERLRLDRQAGQASRLLVWTEAKGIVPLLANVANDRGVPVLSTSGYDSTTVRHDVGMSTREGVPLIVLHVGDLDPHGLAIYDAAREDVVAWAASVGGSAEFVRVAVTREQVAEYDLPDDPDKPGAVQAEALDVATLRGIVADAIASRQDAEIYADMLANEAAMQREALALIGGE